MRERIEPAGEQVSERQRHRDPDWFGDLDVFRCAIGGEVRQPFGDQAG